MNLDTATRVQRAVDVLRGKRLVVLSGAGISTDSGIPDYRSPGSRARAPMTIAQFLGSKDFYRRYWAGSFFGWRQMQSFQPNPAHKAVAELEERGIVSSVLTQNVDSLHERAGSTNVIHLHGNLEKVRCIDHAHLFARDQVTGWLLRDNPGLERLDPVMNPDGDADVQVTDGFIEPYCPLCGSKLKADVIYFGEFMLPETREAAKIATDEAEGLIVAGSSLAVNSGYRYLTKIARAGKPVVIINRGPVKGEELADCKIDGGLSEIVPQLATALVE